MASGSYHDGRSGSYLYTGYRRLRQLDVRSGRSRILFTAPANGKGVGDTSQVCNVSAAPDASGRAMFLDFGYTGKSSVVGRSYGIHEVAFVSDSTGRIVRQIPSPSGEAQWEHMEWSNAPRWAVSGAIDAKGAYANLYLVDIDVGRSTRILSGEQLWQPALWIGESTTTPAGALDSAAMYNMPAAEAGLESFHRKMLLFWQHPERYEVVALGSSRTLHGINTNRIRIPAFNFGIVSGDFFTQDRIIRDYVIPHCPKLRVVILGLMPGFMWRCTTQSTWDQIAPTRGYLFDKSHDFWARSRPKWFKSTTRAKLEAMVLTEDSLGNERSKANGWSDDVTSFHWYDDSWENPVITANLTLMRKLVAHLDSLGLQTILVNFPVNPKYAGTPYAELYGPSWKAYRSLIDSVRTIEKQYGSFHFHDAYRDGKNDYSDSMAMDRDHLSGLGADLLGGRLDSLIATFPKPR